MSFIQIENITFSYADSLKPVFSSLSLRFDTDWKLGLIGKNGKGKTTFLNLLRGTLKGEGTISANIPFLYFPCRIQDTETPAYEIAAKIAPEAQFWQICREINLLKLPDEILYRPFTTLSGGERTKFLLAVLFASEGFPLLDEPTDHLDSEGRKVLANYLSRKRGFLVVSHDRDFLDGCCDHILTFDHNGAQIIQGNYSVWREEHEKKEQADRKEKEKLEKERTRFKTSAARISEWADKAERKKIGGKLDDKYAMIDRGYLGAKAAKLQKRTLSAATRAQQAETELKEKLKCFEEVAELKLSPQRFFKKELLRLNDISVRFPQKALFSHLDFSVQEGERIAVMGENGSGKSTLLKLIAGEFSDFSGKRNVSPRLIISYVPQIYEYRGTLPEYAAKFAIDESYFKAILAKFGFESKDFTRDMRVLSEGQKKKAALARSLCERAHLYLWDEPLNYLDITAREQLEKAILGSDATIIFVEHDRAFTEWIATKIFTL